MKLGFISLNLPGHLNPMTALARHIQARGHEVVFLYSSSANGLPCFPGNDRDPIDENRPEVSRLEGEEALAFAVGLNTERSAAMLKSMPAMLEATGVEALVIDPIQFYVELAAMKLGVPYIHAAVALHIDYSGYTPFPLCGDPYETTPEALTRNRQRVAKFTKLLFNEEIHQYASEAGLEVDWEDAGRSHEPGQRTEMADRRFPELRRCGHPIRIGQAPPKFKSDAFRREPRGPFEVKGKGSMETYFVYRVR